MRGKSCDAFAPFGEYLATTDEIPNPHGLGVLRNPVATTATGERSGSDASLRGLATAPAHC